MSRDEALTRMGLPQDASEAAIKRRYRELCMQHHPDRGGDPATFRALAQLYQLARSQPTTTKQAKRHVKKDTLADLADIVAALADALDKPKIAQVARNIRDGIDRKP